MKQLYTISATFVALLSVLCFRQPLMAQTTYYSKSTATDFNNVNSWGVNTNGTGSTPSSISNTDIFVVANGANLSLSAPASVASLYVGSVSGFIPASPSGTLSINSGDTLTISRPSGNNATFGIGNSGTLVVSGGCMVLNGNFSHAAGQFTQSGGLIVVDGNSDTASSSVPNGISMMRLSGGLTLSGGTINIVDPPIGTSTSAYSLEYSSTLNADVNAAHIFRFGNGVSASASGGVPGFYVGLAVSTGRLSLGALVADGGPSANRWVTFASAGSVFPKLNGDLTINAGAECRMTSSSLTLGGNVLNNGTLTTNTGTLELRSNFPQSIAGTGVFRNNTIQSSVTANFTNLSFFNSSTAGVTFTGTSWNSEPGTVSGIFYTAAPVNLPAGDTFTLGISASNKGTYSSGGGGFTGGTLRRWIGSTSNSEFAFLTPGSGSNSSRNRTLILGNSGAVSTGIVAVTYTPGAGTTIVPAFSDAGSTISEVSNDKWALSQTGITASTWNLSLNGSGLTTYPLVGWARITGALGVVLNNTTSIASSGTVSSPVVSKSNIVGADINSIPVELHIGSPRVYSTVGSGPWESGSTWTGGATPDGGCEGVIIQSGDTVYVNSATASAQFLTIKAGGALVINGNSLTIGCGSGRNATVLDSGSLIVNGGILAINGSLRTETGSYFSQIGGLIRVDGNDQGIPTASVNSTTDIIYIAANTALNLTGGTLLIVDPHESSSSSVNALNCETPYSAGGTHTLQLGDSVSADYGGNADGFVLSGKLRLNHLKVITLDHLIDNRTACFRSAGEILGNFIIAQNGVFVIKSGTTLDIAGNLINDGKLVTIGTLRFKKTSGTSSSVAVAQFVSGSGSFQNAFSAASANFGNLHFDNSNDTGITFSGTKWNSLSGTVSGSLQFASNSTALNRIHIGTGIFTLGSSSGVPGSLTPGAGGFVSGTFRRWIGTNTINFTDASGTFPFVSAASSTSNQNRNLSVNCSGQTGGGTISVKYTDAAGTNPVTPFNDNGAKIEKVSLANWTISQSGISLSTATFGIRLTGEGIATVGNPLNVRITGATGSTIIVGPSDTGSGTQNYPQASKNSTTAASFSTARIVYLGFPKTTYSVQSGAWENAGTWLGGAVPDSCGDVVIDNGDTVTVSGSNVASGSLFINNSGTLIQSGSILRVGCSTARNSLLTNAGTLAVNGGTLNINGAYLQNSPSASLTQTAGTIGVDGNNGGVAASSVAASNAIVNINAGSLNLSGGTLLLTDPHVSTGTSLYVTVAGAASGTHTLQLGDGISTDMSNSGVNGMALYAPGYKFNHFVVNNKVSPANNRFALLKSDISILGNLSILSNAELRNTGINLNLFVGGDLSNSGKLVSGRNANLVLNGTNAQILGGNGIYIDDNTSNNASFGKLRFQNSSAAGITFSGTGWKANFSTVSNSLWFSAVGSSLNRVNIGRDSFRMTGFQLVHEIGGFTGGSFMRDISGDSYVSSSEGLFPFVHIRSAASNEARNVNIGTMAYVGNNRVLVTYMDSVGTHTVTPFTDNGATITSISNAHWTVSQSYQAPSFSNHINAVRITGAGINGAPLVQGIRLVGDTGRILQTVIEDVGGGSAETPYANKNKFYYSDLQNPPVRFHLGYDRNIISAKSGPWDSGSTWVGGISPSAVCENAVIDSGHTVTVNSTASSAKELAILAGGSLKVQGSTLTIGCDTQRRHQLVNSGTLDVSGGSLTINGSLDNQAGNTFNQSGGSIIIDPNAGSNPVLSAAGNAISFPGGGSTYSLTAGSITIVDPPANNIGYTVASSTAAFPAGGTHTFIFGNGSSSDSGSNGFRISDATSQNGWQTMSFQNMVINGPSTGKRYVVGDQVGILGNLTVNSGGWSKMNLHVGGNVLVNSNGILDGSGSFTLALERFVGGVSSPSLTPQTISGTGNFYNNSTAATGNFYGLTINNGSASGVTISPLNTIVQNPGGASVTAKLTLTLGKVRMSSGTLISGERYIGPGTLTWKQGSGIEAGTQFARWHTTSTTGSTIDSGAYPTANAGRYPFISPDSLDRSFFIQRNSPNSDGLIGVSYSDGGTANLDSVSISDGSFTVNRRTKNAWYVSVLSGTPNASTFEIAAVSPTSYVATNPSDNRLVQASGVVGIHQGGMADPGGQRKGLSLANLTSGPFYIGTSISNIASGPQPPYVSAQPANDSVCSGSVAAFSISAANVVSYQWQKNSGMGWTDLSNGSRYNGVTTSTVSIAATTAAMNGDQFRCITQNSFDTTISNSASLRVLPVFIPTISVNTISSSPICAGSPVTFTAVATDTGTSPVYQWLINGRGVGSNNDSFSTSSLNHLDTVSCVLVSNVVCANQDTVVSAGVVVNVQALVNPFVSIDTPSGPICQGSTVTFSATALNGGLTPTYQWFLNGAAVGSNIDSFKTSTLLNKDTLTCILTSNAACLISLVDTSNSIVVRIDSIPAKPSSISGPTLVCSGTNVVYTVPAVATATSYTWNMPSGWTGTSDSTSITAHPSATSGTISVTADNACGSSPPDTLAITANATVIPTVSISAIGGSTICAGATVVFNAVVTDSGALPTYTWRRNGIAVGTGNGFSSSSLIQGDSITLSMTSSLFCATPQTVKSPAIYMTVNPLPVVLPIGGNSAVCIGDTVQLNNATTGGIWTSSDPAIAVISSTGKVAGISAGTDTIRYTVTNASGCSTSVTHFITVNALPVVAAITGNNAVCVSATTTLSNTTSGGAWSSSNNSVATVNSSGQVTGVAAGTDTITYTVTNSSGCKSSVNMVITVKPLPATPSAITGAPSVCSGTTQTYRVSVDTNINSNTWTLPSGWSGTSTVDSIVATTGTASGTVSVTATNSCGTSAASTLAVSSTLTVVPTVSIAAIGGNTICPGDTVAFSYTASDTGSSPSYTWRLNGITAGSSSTFGSRNFIQGDSVTLTISSSALCALPQSKTSAAVYMSVHTLPAAPSVSTPVSYCQNVTAIQLTATGSNLKWYTVPTGGTFSTTAPTPVTSSVGTTSFWVSETNGFGCEGPRAQITVNVIANPAKPSASGTTPVCVGDTIFLSGSSSTGSPVYNWTGPNSFSSSTQNPVIAPAMSANAGVYRLTVTVGACTSAYDSVIVAISCLDSVWPGDVNYDKLVDNTDALEIALAMGSTGPTRSPASILWQPEHCSDWSTMLPSNSSINGKHADCDGDGIVGYSDTLAVSANYGLTHPRGIRNPRKQTAGLPALYFDMTGISPNAGGTITVPIMLGDAATPVQGIAGLAARLMIGGVVPSDTPTITYAGSWLGGSANTLQFAKAVSNSRVDWAYARTDQQNNGGNGVLGWFTFTLPPGANGQQLKLYFDEVLIVDSAGAEFTGYNTEEDSVVVLPALAVSTGVRLQAGLHVLPNPSSGPCVVQLTMPIAGAYTLEVHDLSGRLIWKTSGKGIAGMQKISLPTEDISSGIYLINLLSEVGLASPARWIKN